MYGYRQAQQSCLKFPGTHGVGDFEGILSHQAKLHMRMRTAEIRRQVGEPVIARIAQNAKRYRAAFAGGERSQCRVAAYLAVKHAFGPWQQRAPCRREHKFAAGTDEQCDAVLVFDTPHQFRNRGLRHPQLPSSRCERSLGGREIKGLDLGKRHHEAIVGRRGYAKVTTPT